MVSDGFEPVSERTATLPLRRAELTPLGERGGAVQLEDVSTVEVAFLIEVVEDGGVDGGEGLQTSHAPETEHGPFSSSQWQMRVLDAVVQPSACRLQIRRPKIPLKAARYEGSRSIIICLG